MPWEENQNQTNKQEFQKEQEDAKGSIKSSCQMKQPWDMSNTSDIRKEQNVTAFLFL